MKKEELKELFRKKTVKAGSLALAAVIAVGSFWATSQQSTVIPELVTYVDMDENVVIEGEEVPLAKTTVTKSTKTTKKTKKIKMKKASKKTYTKTGKTKKKTNTKKTKTSKATTTTKTETATKVTNKYKKGSKVNTQVTTVKTTVTKTVVSKQQNTSSKNTTVAAKKQTTAENKAAVTEKTEALLTNGTVSIKTVAPKVDSRVASAYETLHFTINVNSGVSYSGKFSSITQDITLKKINDTVYHELGHFVAFIAGNVDLTSEFQKIYNKEKSLYTASNKAYVLSSSAEYFAESFKEYTLNPAVLKSSRPQTYAAVESALNKITGAQVSAVWNMYKSVWK